MFNFLKNIFKGAKNRSNFEVDEKHRQLVDETAQILHQRWDSIGKMDDGVMSLIVQGNPWPTTVQSFAFIRRNKSIIIASNGLCWPESANAQSSGFGFEVFFETNSIDLKYHVQDDKQYGLAHSFAYSVVVSTADIAAENPSLGDMVDNYGAVSIEFPDFQTGRSASQIPPRFFTDAGALGVLIGAPAPDFSTNLTMPCGQVQLLSITLLTQKELAYIQEYGANGRHVILEGLTALPYEQRISLERPDVTPQ